MPKNDADPLLDFCRKLPGVTEDVKWGNDLVFSVGGKMFAAFGLPEHEPIGFKVEPALFPVLTQRPGVVPAPYLAQHSWVNVKTRDTLPRQELEELLRESHALVAQKLSKKARASLGLEER
ncbi:MAG TPA: MmcQ/YjbR family DNA-binding protein [Thermoanaerobaculia bacterium]